MCDGLASRGSDKNHEIEDAKNSSARLRDCHVSALCSLG